MFSVPNVDPRLRPLFSTLIDGDRGELRPLEEEPAYKLPGRLCLSTDERARLKDKLPPPVILFRKLDAERLDDGVVLAPSWDCEGARVDPR